MNTVYVLGAGASAAAAKENRRVLGGDFLRRAFEKGKGDPRLESVEVFVKEFFHYDGSDRSFLPALEEVLSDVDIALARKEALPGNYSLEKLKELRRNLVFLIYKVLEEAYRSLGNDVTNRFVAKLDREPIVISLNYDIIVDNALKACFGPNLDYGLQYKAYSPYDPLPDFVQPNTVKLYKIHGSLNWAVCPTCHVLYIADPRLGKIAGETFDLHANCQTPGHEPLEAWLITPSNLKSYEQEQVPSIWPQVLLALEKAEQVVFIGYSLPDADFHIKYLLQRGLNHNPQPKIVVVDYKAQDAARPTEEEVRFKRIFGPDITYLTNGFCRYVDEMMGVVQN